MEIHQYLSVFRKRWRIVLACLLLAIGAAAAVIWRATPMYKATTQLFVAVQGANADLGTLAAGGQFTQQRVQSYADIVNSPTVADAVAQQLGAGRTPGVIAGEISASAPLNTVLIDVNVVDPSPRW